MGREPTSEINHLKRQLKAETALEKIRDKALAMRSSDELLKVVNVLREQLDKLNQPGLKGSVVHLYEKGAKEFDAWYAFQSPEINQGKVYSERTRIPVNACALTRKWVDLYFSTKRSYTMHTKGKELKDWVKIRNRLAPKMGAYAGRWTPKEQFYHFSDFSGGTICSVMVEMPSAETIKILGAAAKALGLAYKRYGDLQRAEAQAREAQIEAALERVRARAMAMHTSRELSEVVMLLRQQLHMFKFAEAGCEIVLFDEALKELHYWSANVKQSGLPDVVVIPRMGHPIYQKLWRAWKAQKKRLVITVEGREKEVFDHYNLTKTDFKKFPTAVKKYIASTKIDVFSFAGMKYGFLESIGDNPLSEEDYLTLERFAHVFEQAYTRFLDLQKAESQAREAQIEAALERVRARTMAMHHSDELADTTTGLYKELTKLGIKPYRCNIAIVHGDTDQSTIWSTSNRGDVRRMSSSFNLKGHKHTKAMFIAWKKQSSTIVRIAGKDREQWVRYVSQHAEFEEYQPKTIDWWKIRTEPAILTVFSFKQGFFFIHTTEGIDQEDHEIIERFAKVFEQTYTRFQDLEKAEEQAREAQIETALERVRSATMAMHKSEQLEEVANELNQQLRKLDVEMNNLSLITNVRYKGGEVLGFDCWSASALGIVKNYLPNNKLPSFERWKKLFKKGEGSFQESFSKREKNEVFRFWFKHTGLGQTPKSSQEYILSRESWIRSVVIGKYSAIVLERFDGKRFSEAQESLLRRMGGVFEQAYTRFLDLQKAEAQAYEAQIEAALERVRARTMAMHHSDELASVASVLFHQLQELDIPSLRRCLIGIVQEESSILELWYTGMKGQPRATSILLPIGGNPVITAKIKSWRKGEPFIVKLSGARLKAYLRHVMEHKFDLLRKEKPATSMVQNHVPFSNGFIEVATHEVLNEESLDLLERFAKVFEQTYTRFLDLQRAEAQAREAQIEAALERLRARSMGMHSTIELEECVYVLFDELGDLGIAPRSCGISLPEPNDEKICDTWLILNEAGKKKHHKEDVDFTTHPLLNEVWKGWQKKRSHTAIVITKKLARGYFTHVLGDKAPPVIKDFEEDVHFYFTHFKYGMVYGSFFTEPREEGVILQRFAKVFEQTYTRFLDLQKAEEQAREAQIETALERVRSRTMAMQHSKELPEAANLLFQQVQELGMPAWSAGYCIWDEGQDSFTAWMSSEGVLQPPFRATTDKDWSFIQFREAHERGETFWVGDIGGKDIKKHYRYMRTLPVVGDILDEIADAGHPTPDYQIFHCAYFTHGFLLFITYEPVPESWDIFKRFSAVFDQTYTRFLDLKKAEAQAREAQIEASLERVRAASMAMHRTEELVTVIETVFQQLRLLDIDLDACYINEFEANNWDLHLWVGTGDAAYPQKVTLPYIKHPLFDRTKKARQTGEDFYTVRFENQYRDQFMHHLKTHFKLSDERYRIMMQGSGVNMSTAVTKSAGLSVYNYREVTYTDHENEIIQRVGRVFEQAYTRFLSLQRAEAQAREAQIEAALERVRARALAMHDSTEIEDVVIVMREQMGLLGQSGLMASVVHVYTEGADTFESWSAYGGPGKGKNEVRFTRATIEVNSAKLLRKMIKAYFAQENEYTIKARHEELVEWYRVREKTIPGVWKVMGPPPKELFYRFSNFSGGSLLLISNDPPSEEAMDLQRRAAIVFDLAYRRYLDLQKAEDQAREAQIEAALERVRAASMAMHQSEGLIDVIGVVFDQFHTLGVNFDLCYINVFQDNKDWQAWTATGPGKVHLAEMPYFSHIVMSRMARAHKNGETFYTQLINKKSKDRFMAHFYETVSVKVPRSRKEFIARGEGMTVSVSLLRDVALVFSNYSGELISEEDNQILRRVSRVFDQTYTRFLDLKKAEEQAREAQIEAALERVRARSLAMHNSQELRELITAVFEELKELGFVVPACGLIIYQEDLSAQHWFAGYSHDVYPESYTIPYIDLPYYTDLLDAWRNGKTFASFIMEGRAKVDYAKWLLTKTEFKNLPKEFVELSQMTKPVPLHFADAYNKYGMLEIIGDEPLGKEEQEVLKRFSKVFEQGYTRFLDLEKAEAQAREAQIETALERIRSQSMAMHRTDELWDVVNVVLQQFLFLGIDLDTCFIDIFEDESRDFHSWISTGTETYPNQVRMPYLKHPVFDLQVKAKKKGDTFYTFDLDRKTKERFFDHFYKNAFPITVPRRRKNLIKRGTGITASVTLLEHTSIHMWNYRGIVYTEEENDIMRRVGKVFEQSYTRFMDLQKSEAQAKEARIEAALERVRASMMAMHQSEELQQVIDSVFEQMQSLGFESNASSLCIYKDDLSSEHWFAGFTREVAAESYRIPYTDHPYYTGEVIPWQRGDLFTELVFEGREKTEYAKWLFKNSDFSSLPQAFKKEMLDPRRFYISNANMKYGFIEVVGEQSLSEENVAILKRFAAVFEQCYTRFLDLKKAEIQAREAQIEAALERVRASAMAMHSSSDVEQATAVLFGEVDNLGVEILRCGVSIISDSMEMQTWTASNFSQEKVINISGNIDMSIHPLLKGLFRDWKAGKSYYSYQLKGKNAERYYKALAVSDYQLPPQYLLKEEHYCKGFLFEEGCLFTFSKGDFSDETNAILERFSKVFALTYRRYLDLIAAEKRAQDAIKDSSLDRVRAEIASMRSTKDLERITPLIWKELTTLGVPFFRCGVFIMNEEEEMVHAYLTTPSGESLAAMHLGFDFELDMIQNAISHWRKQKIFVDAWNKEQFIAASKQLMEQGQVENVRTYQAGEKPPERLVLHQVPFNRGMLYVGNVEPLTDDQMDLVKALTDAFAVAYARYEDFNRLEEAKMEVEETLTDLKSAQNQLIHSEKMASLGELTAGIAHEIQNPLNFVNNFSEINKELMEELKEALAAGDMEEVEAIAQDIMDNEDKVTHHGRRAEGIVKSMLQHSRGSSETMELTDINALADEYLRLAYHGLRAKDKSFNADFHTDFEEGLPKIKVIPQEIGRVLLNLINNAFYIVSEKAKGNGQGFSPTVTVTTKRTGQGVEVRVIDNGSGIPKTELDKIFQPFYTTKPTGQGTGLGLSLSYDIVTKGHGGKLEVKTKKDQGSEFIIELPLG